MNLFISDMAHLFNQMGGEAHKWHWFDLSGELRNEHTIDPEPVLKTCRPPFAQTVMVYRAVRDGVIHDLMLTILGDDPVEGIRVMMTVRLNMGKTVALRPFQYSIRDGQLLTDLPVDAPEKEVVDRDNGLYMISLLYQRLMQSRLPAWLPVYERTFTNQRRIEKGKSPKYTWETLIVGAETVARDDLGGTHASPRYHDRRGHQRRLRNGKTVWVKACKVGDPSKGAVFKDYAVRTLQ
jgi:hypothetical protein